MKRELQQPKKITRFLLIGSLITVGISEFQLRQVKAQVNWNSIESSAKKNNPLTWEKTSTAERYNKPEAEWEVVPEPQDKSQPSSKVIWETLSPDDTTVIPPSEEESSSKLVLPRNLKEAEAILDSIPLQSSDFKPLLNLSHAVPTSSVLSHEEWQLISSTISPFKYADSTGNQNYLIRLNYGLSDIFQISGFYSKADDPLNAKITGLDIHPENLWEVFGAAARWKFFTEKSWSLALNGSLESWTVGSGGSNSRRQTTGDISSPNIFNESGKRVETQNFIGSISLPLTWNASDEWQFTLNPGVSFLPSKQGRGQGGAGEFYGTNLYISGGLLWKPIHELGLTAAITQPLGGGNNSFDSDRNYSRVSILSGGLNWHLNPRIALQGQLTNGFGATPATALLTLPSDNRLGYSAKIILTPDAADTPQPPLSSRQRSLSLGGLTVGTALIPPDATTIARIGTDREGGIDTSIEHSISNIYQLNFYRSSRTNALQGTPQARSYNNAGATNWHVSGKAVLTSPLRGAPLWSALRLSFGRSVDASDNTKPGHLFAEIPFTWEANPRIAITINPKLSWSESKTLFGLGIGTNIDLASRWELISEANIVLNSQKESNITLGLRCKISENIALEMYGSTASSTTDIGQILNAEQIHWGSRLTLRL